MELQILELLLYIKMRTGFQNLNLVPDLDLPLLTCAWYQLHSKTWQLPGAFIDATMFRHGSVWLVAVKDACVGVDIGKFASCDATGNVIFVLSDSDPLPVVLHVWLCAGSYVALASLRVDLQAIEYN